MREAIWVAARRIMSLNTIESIRRAGFQGFMTSSALWTSQLQEVPEVAGVYLVLRDSSDLPIFLEKSRAGLYKGKDPTVPVRELIDYWVPNALVLYIGKAGGTGIAQGLKSRLRKYVRSGFAARSSRWGGRLVWQLDDAPTLLLCWLPVLDREPKSLEDELIGDFVKQFGKRPFANL